MNLGSWIVLAIVLVVVGFAIKATFFKGKAKGGCCDVGDAPEGNPACAACAQAPSDGRCAGCDGCSAARFTLQPTIVEVKE